jgi:hypothetical protein
MANHVHTNIKLLNALDRLEDLAADGTGQVAEDAAELLESLSDEQRHPEATFVYDDNLSASLSAKRSEDGVWRFKSDSLGGHSSPAGMPVAAALELAQFITSVEAVVTKRN